MWRVDHHLGSIWRIELLELAAKKRDDLRWTVYFYGGWETYPCYDFPIGKPYNYRFLIVTINELLSIIRPFEASYRVSFSFKIVWLQCWLCNKLQTQRSSFRQNTHSDIRIMKIFFFCSFYLNCESIKTEIRKRISDIALARYRLALL